ncbi:DUF1853 family protein [Cellulophaga sp. HaHaR_3_176]|uniref:DUF1853 family protein n=1 Tax=Cellulophaga sp. HaHaR_3_176 TaxID=1942464 RepID=UPI001C1FA9F8|nr:DUF1853 family protein [Cellulophaga sp. HaHaR_3_176]QWX85325.1 DUF1853 family protein [Cellulophaga sp. HaHaR_3_176]
MNLKHVEGFLHTQELWNSTFDNVPQFIFPKIDLKKFNLKPIPENIRLGQQIEYIFQHLITSSLNYKTLIFNQPIRSENRTLGEIDFILQNTNNQEITHVELTYKFYIIDDTISDEIHQLVGPNRKDAFFEKVQKIKNKQFSLLKTNEALKFLELNNIDPNKITSKACFKAQLFKPFNKHITLQNLNQNCIIGSWLKFTDFDFLVFKECEYYVLTKQEWIVIPNTKVNWVTHDTALKTIKIAHELKRAPMLWMKSSTNKISKLFIVWW